jgi:vesicle-associated membrane protein 4
LLLLHPKEDLQATAGHFKRGANDVRKRMWWKDLKWKIIIALTIIVILGVIIGKKRYNNK